MNPTIGLAMIMKDEIDDLFRIVDNYGKYFDKIYLTVTQRRAFTSIQKKLRQNKKYAKLIELSYFKWEQNFGKARRYNQKFIKTDYWMWIDLDDEIINPENIPSVINYMKIQNLDAVMLEYHYYQDEHGRTIGLHWRERVIRTASKFRWQNVRVHETITQPKKKSEPAIEALAVSDMKIHHKKTLDQMIVSMQRNQPLIRKEWQEHKHPFMAYHIGIQLQIHKKYQEAITYYQYAAKHSTITEVKITALNKLTDIYISMRQFDEALKATDQAMLLDESHPEAFFQKIKIYLELKQPLAAKMWAEIAITKDDRSIKIFAHDPQKYSVVGMHLIILVLLENGDVNKAFEVFERLKEASPEFVQAELAKSTEDNNWVYQFNEAYNQKKALRSVDTIFQYMREHGGDMRMMYQALPPNLQVADQLQPFRNQLFPPRHWPKKSIAYVAGRNAEFWGPENINQGIGGSEEAVIYLSRELAKLGWDITVYCERAMDYLDEVEGAQYPIQYQPWSKMNINDQFDIYLASRAPELVHNINAKKKYVDLHDTIPEERLLKYLNEVDKFFVKSKWHRSIYPNIPDDKFIIIGNGILKDQFA